MMFVPMFVIRAPILKENTKQLILFLAPEEEFTVIPQFTYYISELCKFGAKHSFNLQYRTEKSILFTQ